MGKKKFSPISNASTPETHGSATGSVKSLNSTSVSGFDFRKE
jgi:hypothetical protein